MPRHIGKINMIGLGTFIHKECARFLSVYIQTILAPMVSTLLFYTVFALAFGGAGRMIGDVPYLTFLAPGLIMMSMLQHSFANTSSSIMISKVQGNIVDVLMPPLSPLEICAGYATAGILRGMVVGLACLPPILFFCSIHVASLWAVFGFGILGSALLAIMGILTGLWSTKFDHLAAITNFAVMPMTFLSGTFYSIDSLPPEWRHIAHFNPFFYIIDGFRYGLTGHAESNLWLGFGVLAGLCLLFFTAAYLMIRTGYKTKS